MFSDSHPFSLRQVFPQLGELASAWDSPGSHPGFTPRDLSNFLKLLHLRFFICDVNTFIALHSQSYRENRMSGR